jgi:hypothetical protein
VKDYINLKDVPFIDVLLSELSNTTMSCQYRNELIKNETGNQNMYMKTKYFGAIFSFPAIE